MSDLWFRPAGLFYNKVHVRGPTEWNFLEVQDGHGGFGLAEISAKADGRDVLGVAARLAGRLRGETLDSERAVLEHLRVDESDLAGDIVTRVGCQLIASRGRRCAGAPRANATFRVSSE